MKPHGDTVIVDPLYDSDHVFSQGTDAITGKPVDLVMPFSGRNPMSQQGIVIATNHGFLRVGDYLLYHPFVQVPFRHKGHELLSVRLGDACGILTDEGDLLPLPWDVVIAPDFSETAGRHKRHGSLYIPDQTFNVIPPTTGMVMRMGAKCTTLNEGDRVLFPAPSYHTQRDHTVAGSEIGLETPKGRHVFYTIPEKLLLAILT